MLVDVLVTWKELRVETALNPRTCVDEVDVVTVVVEDPVNGAVEAHTSIGASDLALGIIGVAKG